MPAEPCYHRNKSRRPGTGVQEVWDCPDCGKFRGGGHARWRTPFETVATDIRRDFRAEVAKRRLAPDDSRLKGDREAMETAIGVIREGIKGVQDAAIG